MHGMHPVVELMFSSFGLVAADQLFNQIGQLGHIYNGQVRIPLVIRTRVAIGLGYGAQHSGDPVALFSLFPGWRIVVPTTPFDYIGLFNTAMRTKSPTLIVEHHEFYGHKGIIPAGNLDFMIQSGKAKIVRPGRDLTVVAYGIMTLRSLEAARRLEAEGVEVEVIDLRTVDDAGMDYTLIGQSIVKTGALLTVEEAPRCNSIGAKIATECVRRYYDYFDGPPMAVAAPDIPMPVSRRLEQACIPTLDQICEAMLKTAKRQA
jgi:2-oxoisovalerate dehydrogenase E1 component